MGIGGSNPFASRSVSSGAQGPEQLFSPCLLASCVAGELSGSFWPLLLSKPCPASHPSVGEKVEDTHWEPGAQDNSHPHRTPKQQGTVHPGVQPDSAW